LDVVVEIGYLETPKRNLLVIIEVFWLEISEEMEKFELFATNLLSCLGLTETK
jgi:hypothetical protein